MDVNGTRFHLVLDEREWPAAPGVEWANGALQLGPNDARISPYTASSVWRNALWGSAGSKGVATMLLRGVVSRLVR